MAKTTFTAEQLDKALEAVKTADKDFPDYPLVLGYNGYSVDIWEEDFFPITLRQVGEDKNVTVKMKEYFGGEEGGDHRMYAILEVGWGADARYFEKTGEYNSWDDSYWDGGMTEVVSKEVKTTQWVAKK